VPIGDIPEIALAPATPVAPQAVSRSLAEAAPAGAVGEDASPRCPGCNYDLRALAGDRCPECGTVIDRTALAVRQIPWVLRRNIGYFRAYLTTAWRMFRHPRLIAANMERPVCLSDARRFQNITILLALVPLLALGFWAYYTQVYVWGPVPSGWWLPANASGPSLPTFGSTLGGALEALGVAFAGFCLWLFLKAATGVASYFFHPRSLSITQQNRAIALSYYACAPLAWTPILFAVGAGGAWALPRYYDASAIIVIWAVWKTVLLVILGTIVLGWCRCTLVLLRETTRCSRARVITLGACLPLMWGVLAVLTLGLLPVAYACVAIVIVSLR